MNERGEQFRNRVRIERNALSLVNSTFIRSEPLAGLSGAAIARWYSDSKRTYLDGRLAGVVRLLTEISRQLRINADNSREVFLEGRRKQASLECLLGQLERQCEVVQGRSNFEVEEQVSFVTN
jgi:hypothetical protein